MDIDAYILIGGHSSRLGTDKAFVEIDGMTLAIRALNTIRDSGIASKITFVAGNETQFAIQAITLETPFIFDLVENRGPLGGLHAALSYARTEWIFLMACDYPFVSVEFIKFLSDTINDDFGAVVPIQSDGRIQPLCAFYNVKIALPTVEEIINAPRVPPPMRDVVNSLNSRLVNAREYSHLNDSAHLFININTTSDIDVIRKLAADKRGFTQI